MTDYLRSAGHAIAAGVQAALRAFDADGDDTASRAYLNGATDRIDLELRMRELDGPRRNRMTYPTNFAIH